MIAEQIKKYLKENKMKQNEFAAKCELGPSSISEILKGKYKKPSNELLEKIAHGMGMTVSELTGEEKQPVNEWTLIIEKAKGHHISPEKLEKLVDFLIEDK